MCSDMHAAVELPRIRRIRLRFLLFTDRDRFCNRIYKKKMGKNYVLEFLLAWCGTMLFDVADPDPSPP